MTVCLAHGRMLDQFVPRGLNSFTVLLLRDTMHLTLELSLRFINTIIYILVKVSRKDAWNTVAFLLKQFVLASHDENVACAGRGGFFPGPFSRRKDGL
jgi:hypothetical protein